MANSIGTVRLWRETHRRASPYAKHQFREKDWRSISRFRTQLKSAKVAVSERKLLTVGMQRGLGSVSIEGVKRELARRPLIRGEQDGHLVATTQEMVADEARVIAYASKGRGKLRSSAAIPTGHLARDWLNDGQRAAIRHVLGSRDRVMIIRRRGCGTGKTTLEQELGEALRARPGYRWWPWRRRRKRAAACCVKRRVSPRRTRWHDSSRTKACSNRCGEVWCWSMRQACFRLRTW